MAYNLPRRSKRNPQRLEMFEQLAARIPKPDVGLAEVVHMLVGAYKDINEQHTRLSRDESSTPGARLVKLAKSARTKVIPLLETLDAATVTSNERAAGLEAQISLSYNPANKTFETVGRWREIREHFKRLPRGEALKLLEEARQEGDEDTLVALASCQSYLSGLPKEMHQHTRDVLIEAKAPQQAAALSTLREQQKLVELFQGELAQSLADLIDFNKADEIIAAAREDAAA